MATNLKDFGNKIRNTRIYLGLTQEELAKKIGYKTKGSITRLENGERDLPIDKLKLLAKALNTTPEYLLGWDTIKEDKKMLNGKYDISMLDELEIKKVEKFMSFNEVMFMNEDNELTEDDKDILINSYIQILIQQRNK
ncbi:helix-turn-helix domain-containing protein [Streptobacillus moniliformis]|uniref:helix-turn-helix domain-containing protein n=1 Tax=Streptobacillus moniliformis TaxID=34105 RepID=UPI0007E3916E|nr:helix-turn-helix transcriptional regulator [Streptobacillus moniliformis]